MVDNFALLQTPRRPWLDLDSLKQTFFRLTAEFHPDRIPLMESAAKLKANAQAAELNAAYQCLREPRERLRHLLELELGTKPSDLTQVPEDLMALFFAIAKEFRTVDELLGQQNQATSPLLRVALFERGQEAVERFGGLRQTIAGRRDALLAELESLNATWEVPGGRNVERLQVIWRLLSFYERWLLQIQERVVKLSFST